MKKGFLITGVGSLIVGALIVGYKLVSGTSKQKDCETDEEDV